MARKIRVTAIEKDEPELRLYVLALIALARQLQAEEARKAETAAPPKADTAGASS